MALRDLVLVYMDNPGAQQDLPMKRSLGAKTLAEEGQPFSQRTMTYNP